MESIAEKREKYKVKIIELLKDNNYIIKKLGEIIIENILGFWDLYPEQRFGQIICNYICPDYRNNDKTMITIQIMELLFDGEFYMMSDPFFEENGVTYHRLIDNIKLQLQKKI